MESTKQINRLYVSSEVRFYTIQDLMKMLRWGEDTVQKLFNDPKFPSSDFGKTKVVEAHALIDFFSKKHVKNDDEYWKKEEDQDGSEHLRRNNTRRRLIQG